MVNRLSGFSLGITTFLLISFIFCLPTSEVYAQVICGDVDGITGTDIGDLVWMVEYQFLEGPEPLPHVCASDIDGILGVDVGDLVRMVEFQFLSGPPPLPGCCNIYYRDLDGDSYGDLENWIYGSTQPPGYVENNLDCDDNNADMFPGNPEVCDGVDNDCAGGIDDNPTDGTIYYLDLDGDGFGNSAVFQVLCDPIAPYVATVGNDCDDNNEDMFPGNPEVCDGVDNDCVGGIDDNPVDGTIYYLDQDRDGYGNPAVFQVLCSPSPPFDALNDDDCDDDNASLNQDDLDGDNWTTCDGDCNDNDSENFPGNTETCDGKDNNCNSFIDQAEVPVSVLCPDVPHAVEQCGGASGCLIDYCDGGWVDCDGVYSNGCEVGINNGASCGSPNLNFSMCGDGNCGTYVRNYYYRGEMVFRGFFDECCSGIFGDDFNVRIRLYQPSSGNADYNLYVYNDNCQLVASSTLSGSSTDQITLNWDDRLGYEDGKYFRIEVRFNYGAACDDWHLEFYSWGTKKANPSGEDSETESTVEVIEQHSNPDKEVIDDTN